MDHVRRNSESPGGSSWSLPEGKNPIKILSRSMTSDVLLRNVDLHHQLHANRSSSPTVKTNSLEYKETIEKYVVKTNFDKQRVERNLSDALIIVKSKDAAIAQSSDESLSIKMPGSGKGDQKYRSRSASATEDDFSRASLATPSPRNNSPNLHKILESLYLGDLSAADDRHTLCKLNVHSSVKLITDKMGSDKANSPLCSPPCASKINCKSINLKNIDRDVSVQCLINFFKETNHFLANCRSSAHKVLIYESKSNLNVAGSFVVQYVMQYYRMKYFEARDFVVNASVEFEIPAILDQALKQWENDISGAGSSANCSRPNTPNAAEKSNAKDGTPKLEGRKLPKHIAWE